MSHGTHRKKSSFFRPIPTRLRLFSIFLALGVAVGINGSPLLTRGADAAGLEIPQSWTNNTATPMREVVEGISQASTVITKADILGKSPLFGTPPKTNTASGNEEKTDDTGSNTDTDNTQNTAKSERAKTLQTILNSGIKENFTTTNGTFYVPLEGYAAPSGMTLVGVRGTFVTASAGQNIDTAIAHINEIRKEAYDLGLVDRYVPISRAPALERTSQIRAVEATVYPGHTRPNGQHSSSIKSEGFAADGLENIAWGGRTLHAAIDQWAAEKQNYINARNGKNTGETGHYATMIDPDNTYVGLGMFTHSSKYGTTIVGRFSRTNPSGPSNTLSGAVIQGIYVPSSAVAGSKEFTLQSSAIGSKAVFSTSNRVFNARALLESEINR